uniref:Uncharacterized protein n=1 Tax=Coccidioides posadasii RMSCC 3488 TaxID=454284 RepID=A0A0J6F4C3_COCPO|nr:hypothetical protein CPAG_01359 [Coccidioides posadasii RMSCC 3488]
MAVRYFYIADPPVVLGSPGYEIGMNGSDGLSATRLHASAILERSLARPKIAPSIPRVTGFEGSGPAFPDFPRPCVEEDAARSMWRVLGFPRASQRAKDAALQPPTSVRHSPVAVGLGQDIGGRGALAQAVSPGIPSASPFCDFAQSLVLQTERWAFARDLDTNGQAWGFSLLVAWCSLILHALLGIPGQ